MCDEVFAHCLLADLPDYANVTRPRRMGKEDEILDSETFDDTMGCASSSDTRKAPGDIPGDNAGADAEEMEVDDLASEPFNTEEQTYEQMVHQDVLCIVGDLLDNVVQQVHMQHVVRIIDKSVKKKGPQRRRPTRNGGIHTFGIVDGRRPKRIGRPPNKKERTTKKARSSSRRGLQRNILDDQKVLGIRYMWQNAPQSHGVDTRKYLSNAYNISLRTVRQILHNETWKHVDLNDFTLKFCECPESACKCAAKMVGTFVRA